MDKSVHGERRVGQAVVLSQFWCSGAVQLNATVTTTGVITTALAQRGCSCPTPHTQAGRAKQWLGVALVAWFQGNSATVRDDKG